MAKNTLYTHLDATQTTQQAFDEANDAHRVVPLIDGQPLSPTNPFPTTSLPFVWDYVSMALSGGNTTETYTFKTGGSGGTTVGTVVVVYTSSAREVLLNATITVV
tara:strand:+ start:4714 stop:5028 length:315 start_codon:yes stop_codon:yes gene_type:complete